MRPGSRRRRAGLALASFFFLGSTTAAAQTHVTCVGDSITAGVGASSAATSYPAVLQARLGAGYAVENDGLSGATLLATGDLPYKTSGAYAASSAWVAGGGDVVIQLGANDSKPANWNAAAFQNDCQLLVGHYLGGGRTRVWVNLVPPATAGACCSIDGAVIQNQVVPLLRSCAAAAGVATIDVFSAMSAHPDYLPDGVHPDDRGAALIAETVRAALTRQPTVSLAGTPAPGRVTLAAQPAAAYGRIERVAFFEGAEKRGEVTNAPWTLVLEDVAAGAHAYRAEAFETAGRSAGSSVVFVEVAPRPPGSGSSSGEPGSPAASSSSGEASSAPTDASSTSSELAPSSGAASDDASGCTSGGRGGGAWGLSALAIVALARLRRARRSSRRPPGDPTVSRS